MTETPTTPTQVLYPWRAALRTGLAVLLTAAIVVPIVWSIVQEELAVAGVVIPEGVVSTIGASIAILLAVSAIITRVMAIPAVSDMLTRVGVGPAPYEPRYDVEV